MLKVFDLTLVLYDSEEPLLTLFLGMFALSPFIILIGLSTLLLVNKHTRTWSHAVLFSGLCFSHLINGILKRAIRGPRPVNLWLEELVKKQCFAYGNVSSVGYGMPSAHAQFMFFFCSYILIPRILNGKWRILSFDPVIVMWSILVCVSRVFHMYHTTSQVIFGATVGTVLAILWRWIWMIQPPTCTSSSSSSPPQLFIHTFADRIRQLLCSWFDIQVGGEEHYVKQVITTPSKQHHHKST